MFCLHFAVSKTEEPIHNCIIIVIIVIIVVLQ